MRNNNNESSSGIGVSGLLLVAFIVLKLCKVIAWSWVWVLAPLWVSLLILSLGFIIGLPITIAKMKKEEQNKINYKSKWQIKLEEMQKEQSEKNIK